MKIVRTLICFLALFSLVPAALAQDAPLKQPGRWAQDYVGREADPAVRFGTLPNGLRYAIMRNETPKGAVAMRMLIGSGSFKERDEERGLAHFLEHMAFRGSTNVADGEVVKMLERHGLRFGPDTNASTSHERTLYMFNFPQATPDALSTGFKLFREIGERLTLTPEAVEAEKGVVLSEERVRDTPSYQATKAAMSQLFAGTRVPDRIPIGTIDTIKAATPERLRRYYRANYRPENATIVIVGAIEVDQIEVAIKAGFSDWKGAGPADSFEPRPPVVADRVAEFIAEGAPDTLALNWVGPADRRAQTMDADAEGIARAMGARVLNNRLGDRALQAGSPFIGAQFSFDGSAFDTASIASLSIRADPAKWQPALEAVLEEQGMLLRDGITREEFARAANSWLAQIQSGVEGAPTRRSEGLADGLVSAAYNGSLFLNPAQTQALVRGILLVTTPESATAALRKLFSGAQPLIYRSAHAGAATPAGLQAALAAAQARALPARAAEAAVSWPYTDFGAPGAILSRRDDTALGATFVTFANGTRLAVKRTDFAKNGISISAGFGTGEAGVAGEAARARWAAGLMPAGGTGKLSMTDIRRWVQTGGKILGVNPSFGTRRFYLSGGTRPSDFALQMQFLTAYAVDPGFRPEMTQQLPTLAEMVKTQTNANPGAVFARELSALVVNRDKRFGPPTDADIDATQAGDLAALIRPDLAGPADLVIVGDIAVDEAIRVTAATLGAVARGARPPEPSPRIVMPAGREEPFVVRHGGRADQAVYGLIWPMPDFLSDQKLSVTADIVAALVKARLVDTVREKLGLTYSPAVNAYASLDVGGLGYMRVQTETPPEKFAAMRAAVLDVILDLTRNPISADELERARKPLMENLQKERETNGFWVAQLGVLLRERRIADHILGESAVMASVTVKDVQTLLAGYIASKTPITLISQAR